MFNIKKPFTDDYPITFSFGELPDRKDFQEWYLQMGLKGHAGIDFGLPEKTPVLACSAGKVIKAESDADFGNFIVIQHRWGQSTYAHLNQIEVKVGDKVKTGKLIGLSGDTGTTTGPHLHFAIKPKNPDPYNGYLGYIDPKEFLK